MQVPVPQRDIVAKDSDTAAEGADYGGGRLGVYDLEHTATYIDSELAMRSMHDNYESSLPIHWAMGRLFEHHGLLQ